MRFNSHILRGVGVVHDLTMALAAFAVANILVHGLDGFLTLSGVAEKSSAFVIIAAVCLYFSGLNRGSWRYASIPDLVAILQAATFAVVIFTIANFMISRAENISRTAMVLTWLLMMLGLGGPRVIYRVLKEHFNLLSRQAGATVGKAVLLYPYSDSTENYIRAVRRKNVPGIKVSGIIDPRTSHNGRMLQARPVVGTIDAIIDVVNASRRSSKPIEELIVTDPSVTGGRMTELLEACNNAGIAISKLPDILDPSNARDDHTLAPKPIRIEDLLGRAEIHVDTDKIAAMIRDKIVLVTGAGGSIGSELCRQIASFGPAKLVLLEMGEHNLYLIDSELRETFPDLAIEPLIADVRDRRRIEALFEAIAPEVVFHAAALKHVPLVEDNPVEAIKTNLIGTVNLAETSLACGVKVFVQISTDKAVNPTNVMGATKRAAEAYCQALDLTGAETRFRTVRFGNVLGSSGSVVPRFREQIGKGGPVTVTHADITRFFMTIPEAVRLVLQASAQGLRKDMHRGKILILDMGEPIRIMDLARRMIQLAGLTPDKDIKIEVTGLRPGEKLYEELLASEEQSVDGEGKGFIAASASVADHALLHRSIGDITKAASSENFEQAIKLLKHIVPSFRHKQPPSAPVDGGKNDDDQHSRAI